MPTLSMSPDYFQHMIRVYNTNIDGKRKVPYGLRQVKGIGRRFAFVVCKKAGIDIHRRAGTLTEDEKNRLDAVVKNPTSFGIPTWFLNRNKDVSTRADLQLVSGALDAQLRNDLERMKKMRLHRGLRHSWGLRVRGQHTKTTGRGRNKH